MASTDKGWIKLHRSIMDNDLYMQKPFSRGQAWVDLLLLAEHKTQKKFWRGNLTEFRRGDVCLSILKLSERWGWSRNKVRHFLGQLEELEMVHLNGHQNRTVITIVKYDDFQNQGTPKRTPERTPKGTVDRAVDGTVDEAHLKNNIKNDKESKEYIAPLPDIEDDDFDDDDDGEWIDAKDWLERNGKA